MNCLEYRRRASEDGGREDASMRAHREQCAACSRHARSVQGQDQCVEAALRVAVPEAMAARVLFRQRLVAARDADFDGAVKRALQVPADQGLAERVLARRMAGATPPARARRAQPVLRLALAASIALAVAGGTLLTLRSDAEDRVLDATIAHVADEPALLAGDNLIQRAQLTPVLRLVGLDMSELPGEVTLAIPCPASKRLSLHMVMRGEHGKVTVIITPGEQVKRATRRVSGELAGLLMPVRNGALKVVGHPRENLDAHAERTRQVLRWRM